LIVFGLFLLIGSLSRVARADIIVLEKSAFGGTTLLTFDGLAFGAEVNGLTFGGVTFTYSLGSGNVEIDAGPGTTNNITPPNIVSVGNPTGTLGLILPAFENIFGYGFAVFSTDTSSAVTTVTLFSGATNVGSMNFKGNLDPVFTGGFAGILSTIPFNRVELTFGLSPAFAVDNVRFGTIPEPGSLVLSGTALLAAVLIRRRVGVGDHRSVRDSRVESLKS